MVEKTNSTAIIFPLHNNIPIPTSNGLVENWFKTKSCRTEIENHPDGRLVF